jgi:hypothetical protein
MTAQAAEATAIPFIQNAYLYGLLLHILDKEIWWLIIFFDIVEVVYECIKALTTSFVTEWRTE